MRRSLNTRTGLVLIELIMAAAIAALLLAVVFAVYCSILNTVALQNRWRDKVMPGADALDFIARDLACTVAPFGITNPPFTAAYNEKNEKSEDTFKMSFYSTFPAESSNDWRGYSVGQVTYIMRYDEVMEEFVLIRECNPFRVPWRYQLSAGREKWRGIKKLDIIFFDGSDWVTRWGDAENTNTLPLAARINLVTGQNGRKIIGTEVFINATRQIVPKKMIQNIGQPQR